MVHRAGAGDGEVLSGGPGDDRLIGGKGFDLVSFASARSGISLDLAQGVARGQGLDRIGSIENVRGSSLADRLSGDAHANLIAGGPGNDLISGRRGSDTLLGQVGDDRILGGLSGDVVYGGVGDDDLRGEAEQDLLIGQEGNDDLDGGRGHYDRCRQGTGRGAVVHCEY